MDEKELLDLYEKYIEQYDRKASKTEEKIRNINATRERINQEYNEKLPMVESNMLGKLDYEDFKETFLEEIVLKKRDINNKFDKSITVSDLSTKQTKYGAIWGKDSSFKIASPLYLGAKDILGRQEKGILLDELKKADIYNKYGKLNYFKLASAITKGKIDVLPLYNAYLKNVEGIKDSSKRAEKIHDTLFHGS